MPNRLLLLILHCLFWVNQISWCQICAIWHLLLLANYWRKDKLVTVHAAISTPCGKGSGFPATQYATYSKSVPGLEDEELVAGGWGWNPGAAAWGEKGRRQRGHGQGLRGTAAGGAGSTWCRQQIRLGQFTDSVRQQARRVRKFSQIQARLRKASRCQDLFASSTTWCFLICINPMLRLCSQVSTPVIPPSFDFGCPGHLQWHSTLCSSSSTLLGFLCPGVTAKVILFQWLIWFKWLITLLLVPLT